MENNPIVTTDQQIGTNHYTHVLAKRMRPKVRIEDLEMKEQKAEQSQMKLEEMVKEVHKHYTQE